MAIDCTLHDWAAAQGVHILRLYRWDPFCLSFGRHEPVLRRYGRDRIESLGLDCVRRPTGGRMVWHARELTYAVAAPNSFGSLPVAYERVHRMLLSAVSTLGADAHLAPAPRRTPSPNDGACFASPVGGEILVGERKVLGSAQLRDRGALLQHGSLLLEDDQAPVHALAGESPERAPEAPLSAILDRQVTFDDAADAIMQAAAAWTTTWTEAPVEKILSQATGRGGQFRSEAWTWER